MAAQAVTAEAVAAKNDAEPAADRDQDHRENQGGDLAAGSERLLMRLR